MKFAALPPQLLLLLAAHLMPIAALAAPGPNGNANENAPDGGQHNAPQPAALSSPTAMRKMGLDPNEKFYPEYLAFADSPLPAHQAVFFETRPSLSPAEAAEAASQWLDQEEARILSLAGNDSVSDTRLYRLPYALHEVIDSWPGIFRRGLGLSQRSACPSGMSDCASVGAANKCCASGTYCVAIEDEAAGNLACCPDGATCAGSVGSCPDGAVSCDADLGGGCCLPGWVCYGIGCIPSASVSSTPAQATTITSTMTSIINEMPSTVVVIVTTTILSTPASTQTSTRTIMSTDTGANAPYRPTLTSDDSSPEASPTSDTETESNCPIGYYGCLARNGGGCCQTDRDCATHSCPPTAYTTIASGGVTVAVPATDVPGGSATATCANGWFLCGDDAGPIAGCCPSGYSCGTASCTASGASATEEVQKIHPGESMGSRAGAAVAAWGSLRVALFLAFGVWLCT